MTRQEEIRKGIAKRLFILTHPFEEVHDELLYKWFDDVDDILSYLQDYGCELRYMKCQGVTDSLGHKYYREVREPLIKE